MFECKCNERITTITKWYAAKEKTNRENLDRSVAISSYAKSPFQMRTV